MAYDDWKSEDEEYRLSRCRGLPRNAAREAAEDGGRLVFYSDPLAPEISNPWRRFP